MDGRDVTQDSVDWKTSNGPFFEPSGAVTGQTIAVEAFATDRVGNQGEVMSASGVIPAEESGPLESEEEQNEEENEPPEEFEGTMNTTYSYPPSSSAAFGVSPMVEEEPIPCENFYEWPHPSYHKRTRVNSGTRLRCIGGPLKGFVRTILYENGRVVKDSGERHFNFIDGVNKYASYASVPCVKGSKWRAFGEILKIYPPGYAPPSEAQNNFTPLRTGPCGGSAREWHNIQH